MPSTGLRINIRRVWVKGTFHISCSKMGSKNILLEGNGWGWVWRGSWNLSGWPMVVRKVRDRYEVLGWVRRARDLGGRPRMGVKG